MHFQRKQADISWMDWVSGDILGLPFYPRHLGEISLVNGDLAQAEQYFQDGLALARRFSVQERVAGLTANLGLVAAKRGESPLAIHQLSTATYW